MIDVVYEDNHVIVVIKPVNVPSQADDSGDLDMLSMVKSYIKIKYEKPGEVYIGLIHRLDRPAGGLMVFARTSKAASRLSEQMRLRKIEKRYFAVCGDTESPGVAGGPEVAGSPGVGVRLEAYIAKDSAKNKVAVYDHKVGDAKFAALKYWIVEREAERKLSLVEVELETGRPHQIRAQMAHIGMPLFGDQKYGEGRVGEQLALWSHKLRFEHPVTKEMLEFQSVPALKTEPWKWFSTLIQIAP